MISVIPMDSGEYDMSMGGSTKGWTTETELGDCSGEVNENNARPAAVSCVIRTVGCCERLDRLQRPGNPEFSGTDPFFSETLSV